MLKKNPVDAESGPEVPSEVIFEHLGMPTCLHQIRAADIALKRSQSADIQQFARQMQNDYQDIAEKFMAFVGGLNMPHAPSQDIDLVHRRMIDALEEVAGDVFDEKYIAQQETATTTALEIFGQYEENGSEQHLRHLVQVCVPVLQGHLKMIGEIR
jgi:putative membrane protein